MKLQVFSNVERRDLEKLERISGATRTWARTGWGQRLKGVYIDPRHEAVDRRTPAMVT